MTIFPDGKIKPVMSPKREPFPYGKIVDVGQVGSAIRAKRRAIRMRQEELASLSGVGARFLSEVENGKPSAEIGKVLQVLRRLGLELFIRPRGSDGSAD
jgi:HTH-type transcriptional regulator/antitoxin HipB